jgi:hypothetical protein
MRRSRPSSSSRTRVSGRHSAGGNSASAFVRSPTALAHAAGRPGGVISLAHGSCARAPRTLPDRTANDTVPAKTTRAKVSPIRRQSVPVCLCLFPADLPGVHDVTADSGARTDFSALDATGTYLCFFAGTRAGFKAFWRWRSRTHPGSRLAAETVALIRSIAAANRLWGAEGELLKLGVKVSKRTIPKSMRAATAARPRGPLAHSPARDHPESALAHPHNTTSTNIDLTRSTRHRILHGFARGPAPDRRPRPGRKPARRAAPSRRARSPKQRGPSRCRRRAIRAGHHPWPIREPARPPPGPRGPAQE